LGRNEPAKTAKRRSAYQHEWPPTMVAVAATLGDRHEGAVGRPAAVSFSGWMVDGRSRADADIRLNH
jgi:hypothetical protein